MDKQSSFNDNVSYSCAMIKIDEKTSWFEMIIWPIEGSLIFERYAALQSSITRIFEEINFDKIFDS